MTEMIREVLICYDQPVPAAQLEEFNAEEGTDFKQLQEVLNTLVQPVTFEKNGVKYVTQPSQTPVNREQLLHLHTLIDNQYTVRSGKRDLCFVREDIADQLFDELVRQVTVEQLERGLLLGRIRDEMKMTISCYRTLYEQSIQFSKQKPTLAEESGPDMRRKIQQLEQENSQITAELSFIKGQLKDLEVSEKFKLDQDNKRRGEDILAIKREIEHLNKAIDSGYKDGLVTDEKGRSLTREQGDALWKSKNERHKSATKTTQ